jgi:hypothetical protein
MPASKYAYEVVDEGATPTFATGNHSYFANPVSVGDKIKPSGRNAELKTIIAIEHYSTVSVVHVAK